MQLLLLLHVCLGLTGASIGWNFLMRFPPHNDPTANASHQVTITATSVSTSVTVKVLQSDFTRHISLNGTQSQTIHLPSSVGIASARSSSLLSVASAQPVTVLVTFCIKTGCEHNLLHDVSSWGTHYYPVTPNFPSQTSVSEMVVTNYNQETSVEIFLSGEVVFNGTLYSEGSFLKLHLRSFESISLQSNFSLSGSELYAQESVGVIVGFTCVDHLLGDCVYGFSELKPVSRWSYEYFVPPLINSGKSPSLLLAMTNVNSNLHVTTSNGQKSLSLIGGIMKTIPVLALDEVHIISDVPLQLVYYRHDVGQQASTLTALLSVEDICESGLMFDAVNVTSHLDENGTFYSNLTESKFLHEPKNEGASSTNADVGHYLSTLTKELHPAMCDRNVSSCDDMRCDHKNQCSVRNGHGSCFSKTKICSAWGDSYYRTFDGKPFVLLGNCNYTLVQTTCPGINASTPLQVNIARAYLNGATISSIHSVAIKIYGFNISIVKEERNRIRVNGHGKNLPVILGNGILRLYPSGAGVVLDTSFGLILRYDWVHNIEVEAGPELHGLVCGLCGNANDSSSNVTIASNVSKTLDFTLPWMLDSNTAACMEDCGDDTCQVCSPSQSNPGIIGNSYGNKCTLLKRKDGPFSDCHLHIDPQPFVDSCESNLCLHGAASSVCKVLTAYASVCQRLGGRIQNWREIAKCRLTCPINSHYELCGSACQATCGNPEPRQNCSLPCLELCRCNRGHLLSDGECVLPSKCGCVQNGSYYPPTKPFWMDEQCQEKCICQPQSKTVLCTPSRCQDGEVCKVLNGVLGCHANESGLCVAKGDPHVTTFDGQKLEVHGNCTYLLTSHCPTWGGLQDFSVEVQNHVEKGANVSFRHVQVSVAGYAIEISYEWRSKVMVNGQLMNLPSVLSKGKIMLYLKGQSKCIETDFGVVVTYSPDILTVSMPKVFAGNLCGLCGNFNDEPQDDVAAGDSNITQAIRHWRTSSAKECWDMPMSTSGCSPQEQDLYQGKEFCGRLMDAEGAFRSCHKTVDPQDFYDDCVHDLCIGNQTTLCQILSSYVAVCQEMGARVAEWREPGFCPLTCPSRSEYQLCSTHMFTCAPNPSPLSARCKEGCFCKPGFFHSVGECVPSSECGCSYNGTYYKVHENFYPDENCLRSCACAGRNLVHCRKHSCPAETKCVIKHGHRACYASHLKCTMGGRHFQTFHGQQFDLDLGDLHHLLFQLCDKSGLSAAIHKGRLHLTINDMNMTLSMENFGNVEIDGVVKVLPVDLNGVAVLLSGSLTRVIAADTVITFGGPHLIQLTIPDTPKRLCGLCQSAGADDQRKRSADPMSSHPHQRSVMSDDPVPKSALCFSPTGTNCSADCHDCFSCNAMKEFESDDLCGVLLAPEGSFGICHSTVDPMRFFHNCVKDLCRSNNSDLFCDSLRQYAFACRDAGAEVKPWRGNKCALSCPEHSHYNVCVGACSESCTTLSDVPCPWPCFEGCQCDSGYVRNGNGCVRREQCGCFYLGQYYKVGELLWNVNCSRRCNCCATATLCCKTASCPKGHNCMFNKTWHCEDTKNFFCPANSHYESCGTACPATCESHSISPCTTQCVEGCQCDPGFLLDGDACVAPSQCGCTYNGGRYRGNETFWADGSCTRQCICNPATHQIRCYDASCGDDEYCGLQNGVRSCVQHHNMTCRYSGRHVVTFDKREYNFLGTCQYRLLGICEQGLDVIKVDVQTDDYNQSAQNVLISIYDKRVQLDSKNQESIKVDGIKRNMPFHSNRTTLISLGLHIYFYSEFFSLSISKEGIVVIRLSSIYANATCGLCGNFNSDPADDLTVNGTKEHLSPEQFGKAWRSGQNRWCVEGCRGGSCPNCSSEALERFSDPAACGKILEVNGPFRHCHSEVDPSSFYKSCVSDLCLYGDAQPAVCRSLAEYADVCLHRKALVDAWRSPGFCDDSCPSSTSYNTSNSPVSFCLGVLNMTMEFPPNSGENCLCGAGLVHSGRNCVHPADCGCWDINDDNLEYISLGQETSSCKRKCICHPDGNLACVNVSCSPDEECTLVEGIQGCRPKAEMADCYVNGSQFRTFDGRLFEFHGSCNYTLLETCGDMNVEPLLVAVNGNSSGGKQIYLQVNNMTFMMSTASPGKIQVDQVYKNLPFSGNNITVHQKNGWWTIRVAHLVEMTSDLRNYIEVKLPNAHHQTCGLCGNYNGDPSDDMKLPNGAAVSDPDIFGQSWALSSSDPACNETCNRTCQRCHSSMPKYTSDLYCGLLTQPKGPFSSCHNSTCPEKYYTLCLNKLCVAEGQKQALCDVLEAYEAACNVAGVTVDPWKNITGCAQKCPQFSHFSPCANVCSSLCPAISLATRCSRHCEEGCQCDADHLYNGHACVPPEQCGCLHEGRMIKPTESQLIQNCTVNCTCGPPLVCVEHKCPPMHRCVVLNGTAGCHEDDPCEGKCEQTEHCHLSNGVAICESRPGQCWTWANRHYRTLDGFNYDVQGTCTYLLSGSRGAAGGVKPFMVLKKSDCKDVSSMQLVTVQAYGFVVKFIDKDSIRVNGQVNYLPVVLLRGKIEVSSKEGKTLLKTDFGLRVLFDWNATLLITLDPNYKDIVYGLCGNFNGDPQDEFAIHLVGGNPPNTSVELAQAYRVFDGDDNCCTGCGKNRLDNATLLQDMPKGIDVSHCDDLIDPTGPFAHCYSHVKPGSFYQSCIADLVQGKSEASLEQIATSYSVVCEQLSDYFPPELIIDVTCPPNSHYKTCGSGCPPTCEVEERLCHLACVQGCFCDPGFVNSPEGCIPPQQCGCTDFKGKYHPTNSVFWIPDDCGQLCVCKPGETKCSPSRCPEGMSCKRLPNRKRVCQTDKALNCSIVTGLHFTSFDGQHYDFRDSCTYILVQTNIHLNGLQPFNITISDASCNKRLYHSQTLTLSIYNLKVVVDKEDPGKVRVNGLHRLLPYSHRRGHIDAYPTPSSLVIHVDMGLQVIVYKTGTVVVVLPSGYESAVGGLCGNANADPYDDQIVPDGTQARSTLEFVRSWRLGGAMACRSRCTSTPKSCPADLQRRFEGTAFCGVLTDRRGPFARCALVLSPKLYYHNCLEDACFYGGHYLALCHSIAAFAAACQAAHLPIGHWRADAFCGMTCPKNSHYELCGPRCPVACAGLSSATKCSGSCEEGCQCDAGYVLSNDRCVLVADCGCFFRGEYHPAGYFSHSRCLVCYCHIGKVSCKPTLCMAPGPEEFLSSDDPFDPTPQRYGACEVFAGFGYITFDSLVLRHYGACTYLVSECSPKEMHGYSLLISFEKDVSSVSVRKLIFILAAVEVTINPETLWKIKVNGEDLKVPYNNDMLRAYEDGGRLTITSVTGVKLELSSTKYLRLSVPQDYNGTTSGLCGNFNGDKSDDLELRSGYPAKNLTDLFQSWSIVSPGPNCSVTCGDDCGRCELSSRDRKICDILLMANVEFGHCWSKGVKPQVYRDVCLQAICGGAAYTDAVCLTLEAYTAACRAKGVTVASWRENSPCSFKCPDHSSPSGCVDSNSNSCPALLHPGSSADGCSGGCQCQNGRVFDGARCVPVSQCGCELHGRYIKLDEQLYSENCTERCWCHPLGGALCEKAACNAGQLCSLRNGSWSCVGPQMCQLKGSLQLSAVNGQQLSLEAQTPYELMGLCNETAPNWFSLVSYHGRCEGSGTRLVTVIQVLVARFSIVIKDGVVKVNGHLVLLPYTLSSGMSLSSVVAQDKSEVLVVLKKDAGLESELEMQIGTTMVTVKAASWYTGKLCGLCGNLNDPHSRTLVKTRARSHFQGCFTFGIGSVNSSL
ncbi:IgGFc-binding protein [Festucalex cinctus]